MSSKKKLKKQLSELIRRPTEVTVAALKDFQNSGGSLDSTIRNTTLLCEACRKGATETIETLLACGANIEVSDAHCCTPVYIAASHGHIDILRMLTARGADLEQANKNGFTALVSALQNRHRKCVQVLIEAGANVNVNRPNTLQTEMPILSYVLVAQGDWGLGESLLRAGVRPYKIMAPLGFILLEDPSVEVSTLECFVHAGFDMYVTGWVDLMERRGEEHTITPTQTAVLDLLHCEHAAPRTLQRQCRATVRAALSCTGEPVHITSKIQRLPLSGTVIKFLNLEIL